MTIVLRVILIIVCLLTMVFLIRKIRQAKVQIEDSLFWIFFSAGLLIISIFPQIADFMAGLLGIYSTVNFLFLFIIFILMIKIFNMSLHISQLENRIKELVQRVAIDASGKGEKMRPGEFRREEEQAEKVSEPAEREGKTE